MLYGLDYLSHDPLVDLLAPAESEEAWLKFFRLLKTCNYPLKIVICDDVFPLKKALKQYFPHSQIQLCHNHYLENIRDKLKTRTAVYHRSFFGLLQRYVFTRLNYSNPKILNNYLNYILNQIYQRKAQNDLIRQAILVDIFKRKKELFAYTRIPHCPKDTNLIELFNSHMEGRLKSIKGFKSFHAAERWCNAYLIRRRTKPFTDCKGKFKKLNGKSSLQITLKRHSPWPEIPGVKTLKTER